MKQDSDVKKTIVKTAHEEEGSCGGAMEQKRRNFRRLRSMETQRILHHKKEKVIFKKAYDPTAWYVVQVRRYKEVASRDYLNNPNGFKNGQTGAPYMVEAYAAVQEDEGNKLVIHGKIFVRVDEVNRIDVLKQCPLLKGYAKDPSRSLTAYGFTNFARVPDYQMKALRDILQIADGKVEYSEHFQVNDNVSFRRGILSHAEELKGLQGEVQMINGRHRATIILDKLGVFKFNIPLSYLKKIATK